MKDKITNKITEHSKEKINVYTEYLKTYLTILALNPYTKTINIYEPFAGAGMYSCGTKGSALKCCEIVQNMEKKGKNINIFLNDRGTDEYNSLSEYTKSFNNVHISQEEAKDFISNSLNSQLGDNNFFFIDPYGYTQIERTDIENILKHKVEILLFIPTNFIYRFKGANSEDKNMKGVFDFLASYDIKQNEFKTNINLMEKIKESLVEGKNDRYSYYIQLKTNNKNNIYALFFVTKHIYGAHKFLETKDSLNKNKEQGDLIDSNPLDDGRKKDKLLQFLEESKNNCQLYKYLIIEGILPRHFNKWITDNKSKIQVTYYEGKRRGSFLEYKYYKNDNILCNFQAQGDLL